MGDPYSAPSRRARCHGPTRPTHKALHVLGRPRVGRIVAHGLVDRGAVQLALEAVRPRHAVPPIAWLDPEAIRRGLHVPRPPASAATGPCRAAAGLGETR